MNPSQAVWARIQRVLAGALGADINLAELHQAARLDDLVALDSVALLEFTIGVEREFSIRFESDRLNRDFVTDLPALVAYVSQRQPGKANAEGTS